MFHSNHCSLEVNSHLPGKSNHLNQLIHHAGVELGAWILTVGFCAGLVWLAGNII